MARYSPAYSEYVKRLEEVQLLVASAKSLEKRYQAKRAKEISALCRAAVVLLSSHIEGYIKDLGEIVLDQIFDKRVDRSVFVSRFFYAISRNLFDEMKDTADHDKIADKIFTFISQDSPFWQKIGPFEAPIPPERFIKGFSSPSVEKVASFLRRFGYDDYKSDMKRRLQSNYAATENAVRSIVTARNNIAHGDAREIRTPSDVLQMIQLSILFCRSTDEVFSTWARNHICSIR